MSIDRNDEDENERDSIRLNLEPVSQERNESCPHWKKHDEPRISTLRGISID
jgi:hypothetical protein